MSETATTERGASSRARLLAGAAAELVERGGSLEMASVAARVGVSVGLPYRYFGSKAGLVTAVVEDFYDRLLAHGAEVRALRGVGWARRERRRAELWVAFHYEDPLAPVLLSTLSRDPAVVEVERARLVRIVEDATRGVARAQREGDIPPELDPRMVAAMLIGGTRFVLAEALARRTRPPQDELTDAIAQFVVNGAQARVPAG